MGVDYGTVRIGVALSDPLYITAQPHAVVDAEGCDDALMAIVTESDVERIVVGMPTHLKGRNDGAAAAATALGEHLAELSNLPVEFMDERSTTSEAADALIQSGVRRQERKNVIDKVAAAIMLQRWLDREAMRRG